MANQKIRKNRNLQSSHNIPLTGKLSGKIDFASKSFTAHFSDVQAENSVLGIPVYHTHKKGLSKNGIGKNYGLNLHETFKKENGVLAYTDGDGKNHTFNEYYYYVNENKERVYVNNKSDITIELDGSLKYNGHEVFADYVSDVELKVATDHSDFIGLHLFEKRTDEHKQLQEQVDGYKKALEDFVIFDKTNMTVVKTGNEITEFLANGTLSTEIGTNLLLTQNERFQYESLVNQLESGRIQATSLGRQITLTNRIFPLSRFMPSNEIAYAPDVISSSTNVTIYAKLASVMYSIHEINMHLKAICNSNSGLSNASTIDSCIIANDYISNTVYTGFNLNYFYYLSNNTDDKISGGEVQNKIKQRNLLVSQYKDLVSELSFQRQSLTDQELNVNDMRQIANMQKEHLIAISAYNCEQAQKYYKNYINLKFKLDEMEKQTPVNYLSDGTIIKGYNANGNLVAIYDNQQNYAVVEYEKYRISDDEQGERISRLVDNNEKAVILNYSEKGLLKSITDVFGNCTAYEYDSDNNLTKIIAPDGTQTAIEYYVDDNIITVCDSNKSKALLTFNNDHLEKVTYYSLFSSIDNNGITSNNMIADELNITFSMNSWNENYADFAFDKKTDRFMLNNDGKVIGHYVEENGLVTQAEGYSFTPYYENGEKQPNPHYTVNRTRKEDLNRYSLSDFYFHLTAQETEQSTLNEYHDPVQTIITGVKLTPGDNGNTKTTTINYEYDENNRLTKKTTTISTNALIGDHSKVTNISYNEKGNVVKTESYVINPDGNEDRTLGRNVEEFVYDEQGRQIKSCKYNTLDSTSKFYKEVRYNEQGNQIELDESGENATEYERLNGAVSVKKLPNGSKFAYGYDGQGNLTAISHSTATGEENGTQRSYNCGMATQLRSGNNKINYTYDHKKRIKKISLNNIDNYVNIEYNENIDDTNSDLVTTTNALGETTYVLTDNTTGNVVNVTNNDDVIQNFTYDGRNRLSSITETKNESTIRTFTYGYDDLNRKTSYAESGKYSEQYVYNANGQLATKTTNLWGNTTYTYNYKTDSTLALDSVNISSIYAKVKPLTDALGRNKGKEILNSSGTKFAEEKIAYLKVGDHATSLPSTVTYGNYVNGNYVVGENIKYAYDSMGNIVKVFENGVLTTRYEYDTLSRLTREDNKHFNKTTVYVYDDNGNILKKLVYPFTLKDTENLYELNHTEKVYSYDGDKLISYDGQSCAYNDMGRPTTYLGKAVTWSDIGKPSSYNGSTYEYDTNGRRLKVNSYSFTYDGDGNIISRNDGPDFFYDHAGVACMVYRGTTYLWYRRDAQGNVIALVENGNVVARYVYDAWGNHKVLDANYNEITDTSHVGHINPIRYRGYYYDSETGLYYCNARYYDPTTGRFISADDISYLDPETINGLNLFSYCGNNPVMNVDPSGHLLLTTFGVWAIIGIVSAAVLLGGGAQLVSNALAGETGGDLWRGVAGAALGAGVNALALCLSPFTGGASLVFAAGLGSIVQTGADTLETIIRGENVDIGQTIADLRINFVTTFAGNWLGAKLFPTNGGWFKPQKFLSVFTKPYGQKILLQTAVGAGVSGAVNFIRKINWHSATQKKFIPAIPVLIGPTYPYF